MADADVQGLLVRIEATTAQLRQEIARGEAAVDDAADSIDDSLERIDRAFDETGENAGVLQKAISSAFTGIGIAAGAAVAGLVAITTQAAEYAQEVKNLSALSNTTVTDFQKLAAGAATVGVEQDKLADIFKDVNDRVGEFMQRGGGEMQDFFKEIAPSVSLTAEELHSLSKATGVTIAHFASLSGPEALQLYYTSLEKAGLNQQQMTTYMEAMADEATALIPLLKNGGQGFKEIGEHAEKAGKVLNAFEVDRLVKANLAIKDLQGSLDGASRQMVIGLLPAIEDVTSRLTEMSKNGAMDVIGSAVGFLVENLHILVAIMGGKVAAAFVGYISGLASSTAATYQNRAANIAAAASSVQVAMANQIAAQSAVVRAEREAIAARGTAVQTQMSIQLAEARMAERIATTQLAAAQAGLAASQGGVLAMLGGPAGLAALAVGAGIAFLTMGGNAKTAGADLEALKRPIEELRKEFQALNRDQKEATLVTALRQQEQVVGEADQAFNDFLKTTRQVLGSGIGTRVAGEFVTARTEGKGLTDTLDDLGKRLHIPEEKMRTLKESAGIFANLQVASGQAAAKVAMYRQGIEDLKKPTDSKAEADKLAAKAVEKYTDDLDKQLTKLKDKTAVEQAGTWLTEQKISAESELGKKVLEHAKAIDTQKEADKAATDATNAASAASKKAASETQSRNKALIDLKATSDREVEAANGMAAAYAAGADKSREFTLQQKVEEALLKTGPGVRAAVEKAINDQADAQDRLNVTRAAYDLEQETDDLIAQAKAQLAGAEALEAYNLQKSMTVALAGKNIDYGSKEYELLLDANKAKQEALKLSKQADDAGSIIDRLYPEAKALREYRAEQESLNAAMKLYPDNAALYQAALVKLSAEYEVNRSKATLWGQMTEGAIDRIDQSFASAWANIGSGASTLWDDLKKGFKQTLGEIAHMLTTKPLLASFSNWLTGTDNGQGLGAVWTKLLGSLGGSGGSSSSGGGLWSGVIGLAKDAYSAISALTGVGSAAYTGFASGGVTGALSGISGYYSGMISSGLSTLSGGISSLAAALGFNTVATTAAATTVEGAFAAGVAQMGTQMAINSGTTLGVMGAGAATQAGMGVAPSALSSALSTMGSLWPLAVILGMYQSGKLYDAGVRPDASEMWKSGGGTALGKVAMTPQTLGAKWLEIKDNIVGKVVGDKLAAILSGSTVFQAVWSKVGTKLFGTGYQTKDTGISLAVDGGELNAQQFVYQKKKKGLLSGSNKSRTLYSELDDEVEDALQDRFDATIDGVSSLFKALKVELNGTVLDGLNMEEFRVSSTMPEEEMQKAVDAWFAALGHQALFAISEATKAGLSGFTVEGLQTFVQNLYSVNSVLKHVNVGLFEIGVTGGFQAEQLSAWAGGFDALKESVSAYYEAFFSDAEKTANGLADVRDTFKAANLVLPESREGFRAMVEGIDKSTEAGRQMFLTLMALAPAADAAFDILESRQQGYYDAFYSDAERAAMSIDSVRAEFEKAGVVLPATRSAFRSVVDGIDVTTDAGKKLKEQMLALAGSADTLYTARESVLQSQITLLNNAVTASMSAVQRAVAAEKSALTEAYNTKIDGLNDMVSKAQESISGLTSITSALDSALNNLNGTSDEAVRLMRSQAKATLASALAIGRAGGSLSGFEGLEDALGVIADNDTSMYASLVDFNREQGRNANLVAELNGITGKQLTADQQLLITVQDQIAAAKQQYDDEMARLDKELDLAQAQVDALNEVDNSVLSVRDAVAQLTLAVAAAAAAKAAVPAAPANSGGSYGGTGTAGAPSYNDINAIYQSVLGRDADVAGAAYWAGQAGSGIADLAAAIRADAIKNGELTGHANGGLITGPGTGTSDSIIRRLSNGEYVMRAAAVRMFGTDLLDQMNAGLLPSFGADGVMGAPMLHIPSTAQQSGGGLASMGGAVQFGELIAELKELRAEVGKQGAYLYQTTKNTGSTANDLELIRERGVLTRSKA